MSAMDVTHSSHVMRCPSGFATLEPLPQAFFHCVSSFSCPVYSPTHRNVSRHPSRLDPHLSCPAWEANSGVDLMGVWDCLTPV